MTPVPGDIKVTNPEGTQFRNGDRTKGVGNPGDQGAPERSLTTSTIYSLRFRKH